MAFSAPSNSGGVSSSLGLKEGNKNYSAPFAIITTLFFMWGLMTVLNDILIPHLRNVFTLSYFQAALIQFTFFMGYFIFALPAGWITKKIGYKNSLVLGLVTAGVGAMLFYPAAGLRVYGFFLGALFVLSAGLTILQVAANPYVAILGKPSLAASRLNLAQAFNSVGTTIGGPLGSVTILAGVTTYTVLQLEKMSAEEVTAIRNLEASAVQTPYLILGGMLFLLALAIKLSKLPQIDPGKDQEAAVTGNAVPTTETKTSALQYRHLVLGAFGIFSYVGAEVAIGSFLVNYMTSTVNLGISEETAGTWLAYYWGGMLIGRFIGSAMLTKINPGKLLGVFALIAALLVVISVFTSGWVAVVTILAVGLFNSIGFPTIFTLSIDGLGKNTNQGSAILVMMIVGGALVPLLVGQAADTIGLQLAFLVPVIFYLYVSFYGFIGSKKAI